MGIGKLIQLAMDEFIDGRLEKGVQDKKTSLKFVLDQTRKHVQGIMDKTVGDDFSVGRLDDLCGALDSAPATFAAPVLESIGEGTLENDIINCRQSVKWKILIDELRRVVPSDGRPFSPNVIKSGDNELYRALRLALKREFPDGGFDWELLRKKLPDDLQARYESDKITLDERRRCLEESAKTNIEKLGLSGVVAGLHNDPKKLAYFLDIAGFNLDDKDRDRIVYVSFSGLRQKKSDPKLDRLLSSCVKVLDPVEVTSNVPGMTDQGHVTLTVSVPNGAKYLLVRGPWNRDIKVNGSKEVTFDVILTPGEENKITLLAYDEEETMRSDIKEVVIAQTGDAVDQDCLIDFLKALGEQSFEKIASDEKKSELFRKCIEESVIKYFVGDFAKGEAYVKSVIEKQKYPFVIGIFGEVLKLFREINSLKFPFIRECEQLMFFQKYCVYRISLARRGGVKSMILANEPGLGKTVTALAATHGDELLTVCPNSAVSTWIEQAAQFFDEPFYANLAGLPAQKRMLILEETNRRGVLTNIEFMRLGGEEFSQRIEHTSRKLGLLNRRRHPGLQRATIVDEAHFLKNDSQQTEGTSCLEDDFALLLTASPFRNPHSLCKVMGRIFPEDLRFKNVNAFVKAFPYDDPRALKALHLMVQPYMIRFLKSEVMPTYDSSRPAEEQVFSLPEKRYIDPFETGLGRFTLTKSQQQAILEMFQDWEAWTSKYDHYMPSDKNAHEDGIRGSDNRLTKEHALRQIVNDPKYIGSDELSPKHQMVMEILDKEISTGNKVLVFCRYHEQVKAYAKLLDSRGVKYSMFTGEVTRKGYIKDGSGQRINYVTDNSDNYVLDAHGCPVVATGNQSSKPILAMDYERLAFTNNPEVKVCLATYGAGAQSVNFTVANAAIKDDLPEDYIREYQADDRIHRIDPRHVRKEVRYYSLVSEYDEMFLKGMKSVMVPRVGSDGNPRQVSAYDLWFKQTTLDQVHVGNLESQRVAFELLNNGISVDPDLVEEEVAFKME